jgi:hypothetical protein
MAMKRERREKERMTLSCMNSTGTDVRRAEVMDTALGITIPGGHFSMEGTIWLVLLSLVSTRKSHDT